MKNCATPGIALALALARFCRNHHTYALGVCEKRKQTQRLDIEEEEEKEDSD